METRTTIRLQRLVSSGDLSSVFVAQRNNDDDAVVVNCYNRDIVRTSQERLQRVLRERHALEMAALLPHPFVVGFRFAHVDPAACTRIGNVVLCYRARTRCTLYTTLRPLRVRSVLRAA